jgi:hypothetical protein
VSNLFTADGSSADRTEMRLSNGSTDVFFDVLTLAGCGLAQSPWEQNLVLRFADGHRLGMGISGFDLSEIPWTANWPTEKDFFLMVIDTALGRYGWDKLRYNPPYIAASLAHYRAMLAGFTPVPGAGSRWGDWQTPPLPQLLGRCHAHDLYQGELGCRLCDRSIQPLQ